MLIALLIGVSANNITAQKATVRATIQPSEIMIGEQALINLQVITPKDKTIQFPVYEKEIIPGIEVLTMLKPDTLIENEVMTLNFKYIVTSFDSTLYHIPSIPISDGTDTIYSNSFGLKVTSPELKDSTAAYLEKLKAGETDSIDFEQLQLNDIKGVLKPPFVWTDYLWILWLILGVGLLAAIITAIIYLIIKKRKKGYFFTPPQVLPPHVRALQELDKLKSEKSSLVHGREKEYYTKITDILRIYLLERFGINAMEMTSGEIVKEISEYSETDSVLDNLRQVLSVSDLVKFAKYTPYLDENDLSLINAYFVVNQTREPDPIEESKDKDVKMKEEKL